MSYRPASIYLHNILPSPVAHTGDTARFLLYSFPLKGGTLGLKDGIQITTIWSSTTSANNKTWEIDFGSSNIFALTVSNSLLDVRIGYTFNQNSLSSQRSSRLAGTQDYSVSSTANTVLTSENTANDLTISFYGTLTNTGESIGLYSMYAQIIKVPV